MIEKKNNIGVVIGRFQPFHKGHAWLIKKASERFEKVVILIGSPTKDDKNNPWDLKKRVRMVKKFIKHESLNKKILKIEEIVDVPDDDKWLRIALKKIGNEKFVVVGDNEWVNGIFENAGYKVWRTGYFKRENYEGVKIRQLINEGNLWSDRIPEYLISLIKN